MKDPFLIIASIPASGATWQAGDIPLIRARTLSLTIRCTFNAGATAGGTAELYYSPDGKNWDTIPYADFAITLSAGETVQRTVTIDTPEHGYVKLKIVNNDSSQAITDVKAWYSIQSWAPGEGMARGVITRDVGIEEE